MHRFTVTRNSGRSSTKGLRHGLPLAVLAMSTLTLLTPAQSALAATVTTTSSSTTVSTGTQSTTPSTNVKLTKQEAIDVVTRLFPSPLNLSGMSANVNLQEDPLAPDRQVYQISWNSMAIQRPSGPNLNQRFIIATVDANTGTLLQFQNQQSSWSSMTSISAEQAKADAEGLLQKLAPKYASQLALEPTVTGQNPLSFLFVRKFNGVIAPFDSAQIDLGPDGKLVHYQFNWQKVNFPQAPSHLISKDAARSAFMAALHPSLRYQESFTQFGPGTIKLVYSPVSVNVSQPYLSGIPVIDAGTGQALGVDGKPISAAPSTKIQALVPGGPVNWPVALKQPLTQSQVEQQMRNEFNLSGSDWQVNGNSGGSYGGPFSSDTVYNLSFNNTKTNTNYSFNVDATNGMLTSFYLNNPNVSGPTGSQTGSTRATSKDPLKVADAFVEKLFPHLTGAIARVTKTNKDMQRMGPMSGIGVQYEFLFHDTPFGGFTVFVNPQLGTVVSYNLNQNISQTASLPSKSQAISINAAKEALLERDPLVLQYRLPETINTPNRPYPMHYGTTPQLVYGQMPLTNGTGTLNAVSGKWSSVSTFNRFSPPVLAKNATAQDKAIALLESHGIIAKGSAATDPTKVITRAEFEQWLSKAYGMSVSSNQALNYSDIPAGSPYTRYLLEGVMQGWLSGSGKFRPTDPLTRLQTAKWLIQWMGWSPIATHASYFKLPFSDAKAIPTADQGSAAIAVDAGMIPLTKGAFQPTATLTMGDAAEALVAAIQTYMTAQN